MRTSYGSVLKFIRTVREGFIGSTTVYTRGSCYQFYLLLKEVFPTAEAYYDHNHVITKIKGFYFDINGEVIGDKHLPLTECCNEEHLKEIEGCKFDIYLDVPNNKRY